MGDNVVRRRLVVMRRVSGEDDFGGLKLRDKRNYRAANGCSQDRAQAGRFHRRLPDQGEPQSAASPPGAPCPTDATPTPAAASPSTVWREVIPLVSIPIKRSGSERYGLDWYSNAVSVHRDVGVR